MAIWAPQAAVAHNCSKISFWSHLGASGRPWPKIAPKSAPGAIWAPRAARGPKLVQNELLEPSGRLRPPVAQNCSKMSSWSHLGSGRPWPKIAPKFAPGAIWAPRAARGPKLLQNQFLEQYGRLGPPVAQNCSKMNSWSHLGASGRPWPKIVPK